MKLQMLIVVALCWLEVCHAAEPQWIPPARPRPIDAVIVPARKEAAEFIALLKNTKPLTTEAVETFVHSPVGSCCNDNAETFLEIGEALGRAMLELMKEKR